MGDIVCVAHRTIPDGTLGALAVGGGIYKMIASQAINPGEAVYWDDSGHRLLHSGCPGAKHFGFATPGSAASQDGDLIEVIHAPNGSIIPIP